MARKELLKQEKESTRLRDQLSAQRRKLPWVKVGKNYVFYKDPTGDVFHTYSTYGRGCEPLLGTYTTLDLVPKGRDEDHLDFTMEWVRHHDRYGTDEFADADKLEMHDPAPGDSKTMEITYTRK